MISVLFARADSIYKTLDVDVWDIEREAVKWNGGGQIVAHPPCRAWGQLSHFAKPRRGEKWLAIWSILQIRRHGGVLEHPRASRLWKTMNLPVGQETDSYGGFTLSVNQSWWGHKAEKATLLYICGCKRSDLPAIPIRFDRIEYIVSISGRRKDGSRNKDKKEISKKEREQTPEAFAKWLIEVAKICTKTKVF